MNVVFDDFWPWTGGRRQAARQEGGADRQALASQAPDRSDGERFPHAAKSPAENDCVAGHAGIELRYPEGPSSEIYAVTWANNRRYRGAETIRL